MTTHTKSYYTVRAIVRSIVGLTIVAAVYVGIHLAAAHWWTALLTSAALVALYVGIVKLQNRNS